MPILGALDSAFGMVSVDSFSRKVIQIIASVQYWLTSLWPSWYAALVEYPLASQLIFGRAKAKLLGTQFGNQFGI